ncbi:MAG: flagellar motor protein MotB [Pseudomonadota bacterium]
MASESDHALAPIIIKRKKIVQANGHHGGAWKVAYADFVTAMMAFFLLMWLLGATTEQQRKGIADYFNPSIPVSRVSGGGDDGLNGSSVFTENTYAYQGTGTKTERRSSQSNSGMSNENNDETISANLEALQRKLEETDGRLSKHLNVKLSPEGIILEIVESEDTPLFPIGRSDPTLIMGQLLRVVASSFDDFENDIKIVGHTDNHRFRNSPSYGNWDLSADRANTARRMLQDFGMDTTRIREVSGKADTDPLIPENPSAAQNRRISIVILRT